MTSVQLAQVAEQVRGCTRCGLSATRTQAVPGEGPPNAEILFIGEAPGWNENQQGRPFVGAAGKFLEELLASIGLNRSQVFITNVVKCWPPKNRDPLPEEVAACSPYLTTQIGAIDPLLIVTLGRHSMARFFPGTTISRAHGTTTRYDGRTIFAMYHPATALHQQALRQTLLDDMQKIPAVLDQLRAERTRAAATPEPTTKQLSMF